MQSSNIFLEVYLTFLLVNVLVLNSFYNLYIRDVHLHNVEHVTFVSSNNSMDMLPEVPARYYKIEYCIQFIHMSYVLFVEFVYRTHTFNRKKLFFGYLLKKFDDTRNNHLLRFLRCQEDCKNTIC